LKCSKEFPETILREEHRLFNGSFDSNVGKLLLKNVSIQIFCPQAAQKKTLRKFEKSSTKSHSGDRWQVRPPLWNKPVNSEGGLEYEQKRVCLPGTVG
jgi:hypothetical protein